MEGDSGYFSHRSSEFKFSSATGGSGRVPSPEDLFKLTFDDLNSSKYRYFRYGFEDEEDFEDFKRELLDFRRLKREAQRDLLHDDSGLARTRREERRCADIGDTFADRLSDAEVDRREERLRAGYCESQGAGRVVSQGSEDSADTPRRFSGDSDPLRYTPQVKRSVGLRGGSGGARAKESFVRNKRNGIYFGGDCSTDDSQPRSSLRGTRAKTSNEAEYSEGGRNLEKGNHSPGINNTPDASLFTVPAERRRTSAGSRRVSFRETPERFTVEDQSSLHSDVFTPSREPGSTRKRNSFEIELDDPDEAWVFSEELRTPRRSLDHKGEASLSRKRFSSSDDDSVFEQHVDHRKLPVNPESIERPAPQSPQPIDIPIKLINVPVSRHSCSYDVLNGTESLRKDSGNFVDSRNIASSRDGERIHHTKSTNSCPPSVSVSIPIRVEKQGDRTDARGRERLSVDRRGSFQEKQDNNLKSIGGHFRDEQYSEGVRNHVGEGSEHRGSRTNNPKRSSLLETLRRLSSHGRPRSGRGGEPLMEFFSGDEHFQEFERVFETINNHRSSRDMDARRPGSWWKDDGSEKDPCEEDDLGILHIDETFLDFFDNDEDFMEFERELEKIKSNRRSKLLENLHRRSSCDIFSDVVSYCDRSLQNRTPTSSPKVQRRLSATNSADVELWNSAEEWGMVLNKLKRNSRLLASDPALSGLCSSRALGDSLPRSRTLTRPSVNDAPRGLAGRCLCGRDCQYTCHLNCVPSVTLDCTTVSPGSGEGPVATPTDLPSPSASAETSLTERRTIVNHRSPQKQQTQQASSASSEPALQTAPQSAQHLAAPNGVSGSSNLSQNGASVRDPLSGTYVSQTTSLSSSSLSATSSSVCVERDLNQNAKDIVGASLLEHQHDICDSTNEKDETDSGYRSGTIPDEKLPKAPSQATLNRMELRRKIQTFNHFVPKAALEQREDGESFQGFLRVTLNLIRPITMELGARPPSIYELLTREHIVEQSTQHIAFYMPRDTVKSIHINSKTTTKEVITRLLNKFHILDHPRKFAMYEQEFNEKNKLVKLRRLTDKDFPLLALLSWEPAQVKHYRLVLQENETGEIVWDAFSEPELKNFMIVLDREENEAILQLQYKYRVMKRIINQRMKELLQERQKSRESTA